MRATERLALLSTMVAFVALALSFALVGGELAGWVYPGDFLVWAAGFAVGGLLIVRAAPSHAIGRLFLWAGLFGAMNLLSLQVGATFFPDLRAEAGGYLEGAPVWLVVFDVVFGSGFVWVQILVVAATARFPDGQWVTRWIKWLFWVSLPLQVVSTFGLPPIAVVPVLVIFATVVMRAWRSGPLQRRQMAWALIGIGLFLIIGVGSISPIVPNWLVMSGVVFVPAGFVVAITRYKLYEIDRVMSRTVSYALVVVGMLATFAGLVTAIQFALPIEEDLAVAISTLVAVAVSGPLLRRVRAAVDRRFFRSRYDAARVVSAFAAELGATLNLAEVEARAEAVVDEVFAPTGVDIWLADQGA